jgi:hypothetical protein
VTADRDALRDLLGAFERADRPHPGPTRADAKGAADEALAALRDAAARARRHLDRTEAHPPTGAEAGRFLIEAGMLCEDTGRHTCGAGGEWGHEPGCGLEPLIPLDDLDAMMRAGSRFAARLLQEADDAGDGRARVELWAGDRYDPRARRQRQPVAVVALTEEQAADLVLALGEPSPPELPEHERPAPTPFPGPVEL